MPKRLVDIAEFRAGVSAGNLRPKTAVRLAVQGEIAPAQDSRVIRFCFSDDSVDRYGDTIDARGWALDAFLANPVCLFGHDAESVENVIGRAVKVWVEGSRLMGDVEFAAADVNPAAETVYQMLKAGYLNTVSVGFQPIEWALTKDKARPGGIDFKKQELLEISVVPIPANPNAVIQARAAGLDVDRLALEPAPAPQPKQRKMVKRNLYDVGFLAMILSDLGWLEDMVEWEAAIEEDGSPVPQMLLDAMAALGQALIAMTIEEVSELLADDDAEAEPLDVVSDVVELDAAAVRRKAFTLFRALPVTALPGFAAAMQAHLRRKLLHIEIKDAAPIEIRAGKVLSAANEQTLRDAHGMMTEACGMVLGVCDQATGGADATTEDKSAEARGRRAKALRLLSTKHQAAE